MAFRTGVKLVPVVATGQKEVFPLWKRFRRATVMVRFGRAFEAPSPRDGKASAGDARRFTQEIMYHLAAMLPPPYRGEYADVTERRPDLVALYQTTDEPERSGRR